MTSPFKKISDVGEFFGYLFCIRDDAHLTHLAQPDGKLSTHLALNDLYEDILPFVDDLIEKYQGVHGLINIKVPPVKAYTNALQMVQEKYDYVQEYRTIFKESWAQNIIDQIADLLAKTLYKLKFVK